MENELAESIKNEMVIRSNLLIGAKYSSSLFENKILAFAIQKRTKKTDTGEYFVELSSSEIKSLTGNDSGSLYDQLKKCAKSIIGHKYFIDDKENNRFIASVLVHTATYENGFFRIYFPENSLKYIEKLKSNYTAMELGVLFSFRSNYAYRIYEILKMHAYKIDKDNNPVKVRYDLSELRLTIGCVNIDDPSVNKELEKPYPDFDHIVNEVAPVVLLNEWTHFRQRALDVAKKQINEYSDLYMDYEPIKVSKGGKVIAVLFSIQRNPNYKATKTIYNAVKVVENAEKEQQLTLELLQFFQEESSIKAFHKEGNIKKLIKWADYDIRKVKDAYELLIKQPSVSNAMGWMRKAIEDKYENTEYADSVYGDGNIGEKAYKVMQEYEIYRKQRLEEEAIKSNKNEAINESDDIIDESEIEETIKDKAVKSVKQKPAKTPSVPDKLSLKEKTWYTITQKDDYADFLINLENEGIDENTLCLVYEIDDRIKLYTDWKAKNLN